jgi:hypothetical protein
MSIVRTTDHRYRKDDGPIVRGATGVIQESLNKGWQLDRWKAEQIAGSAVKHRAFIDELVEKGGPKAATAFLVELPDFERDKAGNVGSEVHDLADRIAKGEKPKVAKHLVPFVRAELRFLEDYAPTQRRTEVLGYSDQGYGATLDEINNMGIIERKTTKGLYPEVRLQLAAQKHVDFVGEGVPQSDGSLVATRLYPNKPRRTYVLHIRPEQYEKGYRLIEYDITDADYEAFLACLKLTSWRASLNGKG